MTIAIDDELCLKTNFTKATCTKCTEACPNQSIKENLEVNDGCTDCGLCLANCPVEAISGSGYQVERVQQLIVKEGPIRLGCQKVQPESQWPCLGFLDPILLLTLVYSGKGTNKEVTIYHKECTHCNSNVAAHISRIVEQANSLLGPDRKPILLTNDKIGLEAAQAISRRQFFAELWGASVSAVREMSSPVSGKMEPIPRQKLFCDCHGPELLPRYIHHQTLFKSIEINNTCNACELCAKICRQDALTTMRSNGKMEFSHDPVRCNNCGICAAKCPKGAISIIQATSLETNLIKCVSLPLCANCGNPYQPIGNASVCLECMQKAKMFSL